MNTLARLLARQLLAALRTVQFCIENCPDTEWQQDHGDYPFSQVVFHTLFYTDFYLGRDTIPFKQQVFHLEHQQIFKDYEEMADVLPTELYSREFCLEYLGHCRSKIKEVLASESAGVLAAGSGISFRMMSRAELHVYTTRHIQHHAAQLGFRLQRITGKEMPWISGESESL